MNSETPIVHVVFAARTLRDEPPPEDAVIVVVRYAREPDTFADAAATLTDMGREFFTTWIDQGGIMTNAKARRRAERLQAQALTISLSNGKATRARIYGDEIETVVLDN